jgi:hypothetical protein
VIWSDEKWFVKRTSPNRQNERYWSVINPHQYVECANQGDEKVMAWVGLIDGKILPVYWFQNENGSPISVNGEAYRNMLNEHVYPLIKYSITRKQWWYQQDGATPHCTVENIELLKKKFGGRVISRRSDIAWPSCSPDLNPLDYWFWGYCMLKIREQHPTTMRDVCQIVETVCCNTPAEMVRRSVDISKRVEKCLSNKGGHFQGEM